MLREHACCSLPVSPLSRTHSSLAAVPDRPTDRLPSRLRKMSAPSPPASSLPPHCHSRCSLARIAATANLDRRRSHHPSWARRARRPAAPRHGATVVGTRPGDVIRDAKGRRGGRKGGREGGREEGCFPPCRLFGLPSPSSALARKKT